MGRKMKVTLKQLDQLIELIEEYQEYEVEPQGYHDYAVMASIRAYYKSQILEQVNKILKEHDKD